MLLVNANFATMAGDARHGLIENGALAISEGRIAWIGPLDALPEAQRGRWVESAGELAAEAHRLVDAGDVILVKGSKGSYVSEVVTALRRLAQAVAEKEDV